MTTVIATKTFQQLVQDAINQWAASTNTNPVLNSGDPLLAIFQSSAAQATFLEGLANVLANYGRAQTSTGANLDSWMAQFGFVRLAATPASGTVALSSAQPAAANITIPLGTLVQTSGGAIQYALIADTNQPAYSVSAGAYILPAGQTSINATAQATVAGTASNVSANQLTQLVSSIPGISSVNNASAISNGTNAESDSSFFARWLNFLGSLSQATLAAITNAINSVQAGLDFQVLDNEDQTGATKYGFFTVVVDNGINPPPSSLLTAIANALANVRAFTVQDTVVAPTIITTSINMNIRPASAETTVQAAIVAYINGLTIGSTVFVSSIVTQALQAGASSVQSGLTINGVSTDLTITSLQVARTSSGNVVVGTY